MRAILKISFSLMFLVATVQAEGGNEPEHLPSFWELLFGHESFLGHYIDIAYALIASILFSYLSIKVYRRRQMIPGKLQNFLEMCVEGLYNFISTVLGKETKRYIPFLGTLFFYILINNLMGIIPGGHSPSTNFNVTLSLALLVFLYYQYTALTRLGIGKYLHHLAGEPRNVIGWVLAGPMFVLHLFGDFAVKPGSLAVRLFGNITGEDILVLAFVSLGIVLSQAMFGIDIGLPLNVPFIILGILFSTIQALVFTLLSAIYILLMLPHEEGH